MAERQQAVQLQPCHSGENGLQSQRRVAGDNRQIECIGTLRQESVRRLSAIEF